ncbi:MAG: FAD-dependent oxidoreductase [Egibacteraceae bacterium]
MFADARSVATDTTLEADLCIVGAGAAGITLARAFSGSPVRVVVLESGDMEFDGDTQALYDGPSVGLPFPSLSTPRLRYFGGTTNHWGGICRPFEDEDFEAQDGIPFTGWPIRRTDVASFYPEAARICGVTSEEWDVDDWVRRHEFSPLPVEGTAIVNRVAQVVPRDARSFGDVYSDELRRSGNVTVYLNGNVTGIETDRAGRRVTSVRAATLSGNRFSVQARAFVVAAGAIENARLLLVSNERWPRGLGNSHDLVGRFFSEHPRFVGGVIVPSDPHISVGFYELNVVDGAILQGLPRPVEGGADLGGLPRCPDPGRARLLRRDRRHGHHPQRRLGEAAGQGSPTGAGDPRLRPPRRHRRRGSDHVAAVHDPRRPGPRPVPGGAGQGPGIVPSRGRGAHAPAGGQRRHPRLRGPRRRAARAHRPGDADRAGSQPRQPRPADRRP